MNDECKMNKLNDAGGRYYRIRVARPDLLGGCGDDMVGGIVRGRKSSWR